MTSSRIPSDLLVPGSGPSTDILISSHSCHAHCSISADCVFMMIFVCYGPVNLRRSNQNKQINKNEVVHGAEKNAPQWQSYLIGKVNLFSLHWRY